METAVVQDQGVQVGDLFACSWGYDQTQVDFYEVVGLTPSGKSVRVQKVHQENVTDPRKSSYRVKPVQGSYAGPVETKRIKDVTWGSEVKYAFKVNSYSNAYKSDWDSTWTVTGWGYGH